MKLIHWVKKARTVKGQVLNVAVKKNGLRTAYSAEIKSLSAPHKKQLVAFLEQAVKELKDDEDN